MKRTTLFLSSLLLLLGAFSSLCAQTKNECIDEVLSYESMGKPATDSLALSQSTYLSYALRVTNWDNEVTTSNVKMYKMGKLMNFFSEQATIFMDEEEVLIVMPEQKVLVINSVSKDEKNSLNDDFFEMRRAFMDSCELVTCEQKSPTSKTLVLRSKNRGDGALSIESMSYDYNPAEKKITRIKVNYTKNYKIKQMVMVYKEFNPASSYKFLPVRKQYADRRGNINEAYKTYEIVDNRNIKSNTKNKAKN